MGGNFPEDGRTRSDYYQTPNIERLAREGMRFTQGYAPAPFCCPTRRSLLVGQTPARHIYQRDQRNWTTRYRQQLSLPRMLKQANPDYRSAHFGKWDMRFDEVTPEEMGYDLSDGITGNATGGGKGSGGPSASSDPKLIFSITDRATRFIEEQVAADHPFFVQVSHYAVHLDIFYRADSLADAQARERGGKHTMPEFAAMTHDVDAGIGRLLDRMKSLGVGDTTYVFFLSDNGGRNTIPGQASKERHRNHPLRDGKGSVYEGGIRVPFIVKGPRIAEGTVSRAPVTGLDIFPTIAALAGHHGRLPDSLDGGNLTPVLFHSGRGVVKRSRPFLFFHQAVARPAESALILGRYKLVKTWAKGTLELFDLAGHPGESENLAARHPEMVTELHRLMVEFLSEVEAETRKTGSKKDAYENAKLGGDS